MRGVTLAASQRASQPGHDVTVTAGKRAQCTALQCNVDRQGALLTCLPNDHASIEANLCAAAMTARCDQCLHDCGVYCRIY